MSVPAENAIQQDASEQSDNESGAANAEGATTTEVMSPRMQAMEAIAAGRLKSLEADEVDVSGMGEKPIQAAAADQDANDDEGSDQLAAQLGADERPTTFASESLLVKVKVDGEEIELPLSEVVKSYQKDQTASRRLTQASRILQEAEEKAKSIAQKKDEENNSSIAIEKPATEDKQERLGKIKGVFSKLYGGDEEGAAEEMLQLIGQGATQAVTATQPPPIDPTQIADQVRQQLAVESAYGQVQTDYPAIFADDERGVVLGKAAFERMTAKETLGVPRSQALLEATAEVATLFGIQKSGRPAEPKIPTARDTKLERKANLDIPDAANVVAGSKQAPAEAPNVSQTIAEMARSRLGQSLPAR